MAQDECSQFHTRLLPPDSEYLHNFSNLFQFTPRLHLEFIICQNSLGFFIAALWYIHMRVRKFQSIFLMVRKVALYRLNPAFQQGLIQDSAQILILNAMKLKKFCCVCVCLCGWVGGGGGGWWWGIEGTHLDFFNVLQKLNNFSLPDRHFVSELKLQLRKIAKET